MITYSNVPPRSITPKPSYLAVVNYSYYTLAFTLTTFIKDYS